jgi:ParB-like chromosome segregation protein Spo0J
MNKKSEVVLVNINSIHPNKKKLEMYQTPENYKNIKWSIENEGIIEPLLVNEKTKEIISGNLRYQVAKDLGIKEMDIKSI